MTKTRLREKLVLRYRYINDITHEEFNKWFEEKVDFLVPLIDKDNAFYSTNPCLESIAILKFNCEVVGTYGDWIQTHRFRTSHT